MEIGLSSTGTNNGTLESLVTEAREAAAVGLASFWVPNFFGLDALTSLVVVGKEVPGLALGTAVMPIYTRHPFALAQQALTVHAAVDGRLTLGIGLSHRPIVEGAWGLRFDRPAATMREYLVSLAGLLDRTERLAPPPVPDRPTPPAVPGASRLPVLVAALAPRMVDLAGTLADGVVLWSAGPTAVAAIVGRLRAAAHAAGRPEPRVVASLPVCVTDDPERSRSRIARWFGSVEDLPTYRRALDAEGRQGLADVSLVGSGDVVAVGLRRLHDAGVTEFTAMVTASSAQERAATVEVLAQLAAAR